jgi:hypothetical protein
MNMARRQIDPSDFSRIPSIRAVIKTLPKEIRVCGQHGEAVHIEESDFSSQSWGSAPFGKADWVGCSEEAIDRVIEAVEKTLDLIDRAKQTYQEKLASRLEPKHSGAIVAIELGTNDYFVGTDEVDASEKARAAGHDGTLFFLRIGSPYTHRLNTP